MTNSVVQGVFAKFLGVPSRGVVQIVVEVPSEAADNALAALGGWPNPSESRWVAVALLTEEAATRAATPAEKPKQRWADMGRTQRAGILCNSEEFQRFLAVIYEIGIGDDGPHDAAVFVRDHCKVESRSMLDGEYNNEAAELWDVLELEYDAWRGRTARPEDRQESAQ